MAVGSSGVAAAVPAQLPAERHMNVNRKRIVKADLAELSREVGGRHLFVKMQGGRKARIAGRPHPQIFAPLRFHGAHHARARRAAS